MNSAELGSILRLCRKYNVATIRMDDIEIVFGHGKPKPKPSQKATPEPEEAIQEDPRRKELELLLHSEGLPQEEIDKLL